MALDANAQYVPLTFKTTTKSDGSLAVTGLQHTTNLSATLSGTITSAVDFYYGDAYEGSQVNIKDGAYKIALINASGKFSKTTQLVYDTSTGKLYTSSLDVYGDSSLTVSGNTTLSSLTVCGTLSALSGLSVSASISAVDSEGHALVVRRDDDASYENLIKAYDGTLTLQAEDDVHLKSNTGEDFARFNENAAVWLYHNNIKKLETATDGVYTCLLYTSPSPRDGLLSRMPSSA